MGSKTSTLISMGVVVALIVAGIWFLYNQPFGFGHGPGRWIMPHHMMMRGGGMGGIMTLFWILVTVAIVLIISGAVTGRSSSGPDHREVDSEALEILKQRYARGEIDKARFEEMRRDIL